MPSKKKTSKDSGKGQLSKLSANQKKNYSKLSREAGWSPVSTDLRFRGPEFSPGKSKGISLQDTPKSIFGKLFSKDMLLNWREETNKEIGENYADLRMISEEEQERYLGSYFYLQVEETRCPLKNLWHVHHPGWLGKTRWEDVHSTRDFDIAVFEGAFNENALKYWDLGTHIDIDDNHLNVPVDGPDVTTNPFKPHIKGIDIHLAGQRNHHYRPYIFRSYGRSKYHKQLKPLEIIEFMDCVVPKNTKYVYSFDGGILQMILLNTWTKITVTILLLGTVKDPHTAGNYGKMKYHIMNVAHTTTKITIKQHKSSWHIN